MSAGGFDVGSIFSKLVLNSADFKSGLDEAKKRAIDFGEELKNQHKNVEKLGTTMAAAGAVVTGALGAMVASTASYVSEMVSLERRTGMAQDVLAGLGQAADETGVEIGTLQMGLGLLARKAYEASEGNDAAQKVFTRMGVSATDSAGKLRPMNDVLYDVADKFKSMPAGAEKTALAMEMFGRSGAELIPMLNKGSEGLRENTEEARKLGLVLDKETIAKSKEMKIQFNDLKDSMMGVALQVSKTLMPMITSLTKTITGVVTAVNAWTQEHPMLTSALTTVAKVAGMLLVVGGGLLVTVGKLAGAWGEFGKVLSGVSSVLGKVPGLLTALTGPFGIALGVVVAITAAIKLWSAAQDQAMAGIIADTNKMGEGYKKVRDFQRTANADQLHDLAKYREGLRATGVSEDELAKKTIAYVEKFKSLQVEKTSVVKAASDEIAKIHTTLIASLEKLTLNEYEFERREAKRAYDENIKQINATSDAEDKKQGERKIAYSIFQAELRKIEKDSGLKRLAQEAAVQKEMEKEDAEYDKRWEQREEGLAKFEEKLHATQAKKQSGYLSNEEKNRRALSDEMKRLSTGEYEYSLYLLAQEEQAELRYWQNESTAFQTFEAEKAAVAKKYADQRAKLERDNTMQYIDLSNQMLQSVNQFIQAEYSNRSKAIDDEYNKRKAAIEASTMNEKEKAEAIKKLDEETAKAKRKVEHDAAVSNKAASLVNAAVNIATGITKALAQGGFFGIFMTAVVAAMGAVQLAMIARQPIPALAEGGIVTRPTLALIGEDGPEAVVPLRQKNGKGMGMGGDRTVNLRITIQALDTQSMEDAVNRKVIPLLQSAMRNERFRVPMNAIAAAV